MEEDTTSAFNQTLFERPVTTDCAHSDSSRTNSSSDTESDEEENLHQDIKDAFHNASTVEALGCFICPNENDPIEIKKVFIRKHPIQIHESNGNKLPFDPTKLYYRRLPNGDKIHRKWLSYSARLNKVFCSSCMAFGDKEHRDSTFITGHECSPKHIYKSVEIHEDSQHHQFAAKAAFACLKNRDV